MTSSLTLLTLSLIACGELPQGADDGSAVPAPIAPHFVRLPEIDRVVFSRPDTTDNRLIDHYEVCADECVDTAQNFADFPANDHLTVTVTAIGFDGTRSDELEIALGENVTWDLRSDPVESEAADTGAAGLTADDTGAIAPPHGTTASSYATPPTTVYSPVYGSTKEIPSTSATNTTSREWGFWQHKGGFHHAGGGINGSDDTMAWDVNLNVTGASSNMDKKMEFFSAGFGWVATEWKRGYGPGTDGCKSVLIDHSGWFSGYLHAYSVSVAGGDYVTPSTQIGKIGNTGVTDGNYHLHFATYSGTNTVGGLVSYDVSLAENPVSISMGSTTTVARGASTTLTTTATRTNHAVSHGYGGTAPSSVNLNAAAVYDNTYWKSSDTSKVRVDGYGKVTGVAAGSATITVYYSGETKTKVITVP